MTQNQAEHPLVKHYLDELAEAARSLPSRERDDLIAEIRGHLHERLATEEPSEAAIRNVLAELGEPNAIVAATQSKGVVDGPGPREITAILLLLFGGVVLPVVGWFIALAVLWSSAAWTTNAKLLGTMVIPGGLILPALMLSLVSPVSLPVWLAGPALVILTVAPIATAIHLWRSAERRPV